MIKIIVRMLFLALFSIKWYNLLYKTDRGGANMEAVAYSNFRQNLKHYMKQVNDDAEPLIVTSKNIGDTVVVLSKRDYDSMQETFRIMSNNYLMNKIKRGDEQFKAANFQTHELLEVADD